MSEPNSLYARIQISKKAKNDYLESKIASPEKYTDWSKWLENNEYNGSITQDEINNMKFPGSTDNREFIYGWIESEFTEGFSEYIEHEKTWVLSMIEFSENYFDYVKCLHSLRSVDNFTDNESGGFILIHSYLWGDTDSDVAIKIGKGESVILDSVPQDYVAEARKHLDQRMAILEQRYKS